MVSTPQLYARAHAVGNARTTGNSGAPFMGAVTSVNPTTETMTVAHGTGTARNVRIPHPYAGQNSWHRVIPDAAQQVVLQIRQDSRTPVATAYHQSPNREDTPETRVQRYMRNQDLYRPLAAGEHELMSSGLAQVYLGRRPYASIRGGFVRSWWDQDRMEAGSRSGLHVRQSIGNEPTALSDEERFGVVQRADVGRPANVALNAQSVGSAALAAGQQAADGVEAGGLKSSVRVKFVQAPAGVPAAGPPQQVNVSAASDPTAAAAAASTAAFAPAKERSWVLNGAGGLLDKLVERREGHVMDDSGQAVQGKASRDLRFQHQVFGLAGGATSRAPQVQGSGASQDEGPDSSVTSGVGAPNYLHQIDMDGNVYIGLPATATTGIKFEIPGGKFEVKSGTASSSFKMAGNEGAMTLKSTVSAVIRAETSAKMHSLKVKLGQTDAAINNAVSTVNYKTGERGLHGSYLALHTAASAVDTAASTALNLMGSIVMAISAAPLCPGVLVAGMGRVHTLIGVVKATAAGVIKNALGAAGTVYSAGWDTAYESQSVSYSS